MIRKTVNYEDFDGKAKNRVCYFNLTENELIDVALTLPDDDSVTYDESGNVDRVEVATRMFSALGKKDLYEFIKTLVIKSYGVKSADGEYFDKSEEVKRKFVSSMAYTKILMELMSDSKAASDFVNGIIPQDIVNKMIERQKAQIAEFPVV